MMTRLACAIVLFAAGTVGSAPITGKVKAVETEIGLVVISIGQQDGVAVGDGFTIMRDGAFVAKITIDRVGPTWAAGRIVSKKDDPRLGDDVTDLTPPEDMSAPARAEEVQSIRRKLDEIRAQVRLLSDRLLPAWQEQGVAADELPPEILGHFGLERGLILRRLRKGSAADHMGLKPFDIVPDLTEAQLLETLNAGAPLRILRAGREHKLGS